jgi:DNA-binding beta-propeller fold protein YncE
MRRLWLALPLMTLSVLDCYSQGDGTAPPQDVFYFPVGLSVSANGTVLYAANSDFDLQYNGGTLQSYDLRLIREHAYDLVTDPTKTLQPNSPLPFVAPPNGTCPTGPEEFKNDGSGTRQPLGETCAPPVRSQFYFRRSGIIGAFATDLLRSLPPDQLDPGAKSPFPASAVCDATHRCQDPAFQCFGVVGTHPGTCELLGDNKGRVRPFDRLFVPVRGNASVTWATVVRDMQDAVAPPDWPNTPYAPFELGCGQDSKNRCDQFHEAGTDPDQPETNTRRLVMPGEPFGIALAPDGQSLLVTHQSDTKTSLFTTGLTRTDGVVFPNGTPHQGDDYPHPGLDFILDGMPSGGVGLAAIPHDRDAFDVTTYPRPAFLWTTRAAPEVDLIRRYPDQANQDPTVDSSGSSLVRPFIDREAAFPISPTAAGTDSRGIAIDPTQRIRCKSQVAPADPLSGRTQADVDKETTACARLPARVFIANRSPASLLIGNLGGESTDGGAFDPDKLTLHTSIPLQAGPSHVYLAPIVDKDGAYALRVFVVCFDSATVFVFDPDTQQVENIIRVAAGPFAMTFDPFVMDDVATNKQVPLDPIEVGLGRKLRRFRFAYVASFTLSHVQLIDLDDAQADRDTFERVVFTLGQPTSPKGT